MGAVMSQMALLACGLVLGFVLRRVKIMNDDVIHGMTRLVIDVTMPCMIVAAVITRDSLPDIPTIGMIFAAAWGMYAVILAVAFVVPYLFRLDKSKFGTYRFMTVFGNTGFLGFPLCAAVFGQQSVLYASIFNIPFNILCFTVGILMLSQDHSKSAAQQFKECSKQLVSPTLISCFAALTLALLGVCDVGTPGMIMKTFGDMTTPAALLILGANLSNVPAKTLVSHLRPFMLAATRLILVPLLVFFIFRNIITDPVVLGVLVVTCGMPVATNGTLLCVRYGGDLDTIVSCTFITTVLSIATIPLLVSIVV